MRLDEFAKEQEFGDKCLQLMYELVHVTVNQVMVPEKFYELYERMERLHSRGINVTLKPMSNPTASGIVEGYDDASESYRDITFTDNLHTGVPKYFLEGFLLNSVNPSVALFWLATITLAIKRSEQNTMWIFVFFACIFATVKAFMHFWHAT